MWYNLIREFVAGGKNQLATKKPPISVTQKPNFPSPEQIKLYVLLIKVIAIVEAKLLFTNRLFTVNCAIGRDPRVQVKNIFDMIWTWEPKKISLVAWNHIVYGISPGRTFGQLKIEINWFMMTIKTCVNQMQVPSRFIWKQKENNLPNQSINS